MAIFKRRSRAEKNTHILMRVGFRTAALLSLLVAFSVAPLWLFGPSASPNNSDRRLSAGHTHGDPRLACYDFTVEDFKPYCEYSNYGSFPGSTIEPTAAEHVIVNNTKGYNSSQCAIKDCKIGGDYYLCQYTTILDSKTDDELKVLNIAKNETKNIFNTVAYMPPVSPFKWYGLLCYIIGLCYMFLGLAIVCDEFFVPALEEIVERTGMTEDVAGATLMAAGGSAPELFTSILGTFVTKSSVGFGTIVGSAVFNVLFVIGMCAIFSKEELTLTMWPLFRDSTYYLFSLLAVAVFFSVISPGEIHWWEALILLMMYGLYVVVMKYNKALHGLFNRTFTSKKAAEAAKIAPAEDEAAKVKSEDAVTGVDSAEAVAPESKQEKPAPKMKARSGSVTAEMMMKKNDHGDGGGQRRMMARARQKTIRSLHTSYEPPTFRAGVLHFMKTHKFEVDNLRVHVVSELPGGIKETFDKLDTNGDGTIDKHEMSILLMNLLKRIPDDNEVIQTIREIGPKGPETVSYDEFAEWYSESETRLEQAMLTAFKSMDDNDNDHVDKRAVNALLKRLIGEEPGPEMIRCAMKEFDKENDGFITLDEFRKWYKSSMLYQSQAQALEEEEEEGLDAMPPFDKGFKALFIWFITIPIVGPLWLTVPDVRRETRKHLFPVTWTLSIFWIAFYSYFMVWWATLIGDRFGVPPVVMGLTFLAAGTSIPDLLTSVIVARQGLGDMAVSSSIGSNIFDVLIGLPVPWLIHGIAIGPFKVGAENLEISILVLCAMLFVLVLSIHLSGWKMSKTLGYTMFFFYGIFVAQDLVQQKQLGCL